MQSNKAPKKTRKVAHETGIAADTNTAAEVTTSPRGAKSSKTTKPETTEMGLASHQHKTGSSALEPAKTENTTALKAMAAAVGQETAQPVSHEEIAKLAHSYWAARGYSHGSAEADWLRAEQDLQTSR